MKEDVNQRIKDAFINMLNQSCGEWIYDEKTKQRTFGGYDSHCLSAYEDALDLAVELGWIEEKDVIR